MEILIVSFVAKEVFQKQALVEKRIRTLNSRIDQLKYYTNRFRGKVGDTLTYCLIALRVEFQKEVPDDPETTGDGTFDLREEGEPGSWDYKPPYDSLYFVSLMEFAKRYYEEITYNRIRVTYTVLPVVRVPHPIRYYGDLNFFAQGITSFFRDAIRAVDTQTDFVFSDILNNCPNSTNLVFPRVVIFFAGGAYQTDRGDTPYDLPAVTIFSGALEYFLGEPYIIANNGLDTIYDATLIPQTMSQDGANVGLHGTLVHELNHLMFFTNDIYDYNGIGTGAGYYDLMAVGGYGGDVDGIPEGYLPTQPGAYTRLYMDSILNLICPTCQRIVEPNEILNVYPWDARNPLQVDLKPSSFHPNFVRIFLDRDEYYLIEFRKRENLEDGKVEFVRSPDNRFILGVMYGEWDYALPGEGILIWHVDMNIIDSFGFEHQSARPMGVDLIEADGFQDFEYFVRFEEGWKGSMYDPFYAPYKDELSESTYPSTLSNENKETGYRIYDISEVSQSMSFSITNNKLVIYHGRNYLTENVDYQRHFFIVKDVDSDGKDEIFILFEAQVDTIDPATYTVSISSELMILDDDGTPYYTNKLVRIFNETRSYSYYPFLFRYPPLVEDMDGDGTYELYLANSSGSIQAFSIASNFSSKFNYTHDYPIRSCISRIGNFLLFGDDAGNVHLLDPLNLNIVSSFPMYQPFAGCFAYDGNSIYLQSSNGILYKLDGMLNLLGRVQLELSPNPLHTTPVPIKDRIYTITNSYLWILTKELEVIKKVELRSTPKSIFPTSKGVAILTEAGTYIYNLDGSLSGYVGNVPFGVSNTDTFMFHSYRFNYSKGFSEVYPAIANDSLYVFSDVRGNIYMYRIESKEPVVKDFYTFLDENVRTIQPTYIKPTFYPNPARKGQRGTLRFYSKAGEKHTIVMFNFSGRIVKRWEYTAKLEGIQELVIELPEQKGAYMILIDNKERVKLFVR